MTTHRPIRSLWLGLAALALAGCQAPAGPIAVQSEGAPAPDQTQIAAFHRAAGLPERLRAPGAGEAPGTSGYALAQAADNLFGGEIPVSTAAGSQEFADVCYNPSAKNYMAVWHDFRNGTDGSNADLYGQLIGPSGLLTGAVLPLVSVAGSMQLGPRIAVNGAGTEYLVAWTDSRAGNTDVYAQRFTAAGAATGAAVVVASGTSNQTLSGLVYHAARNEYMLTWTDDRLGFTTLEAGRLTAAAAKTGTDVTVSSTPGALGGGAVAVNATSGDYIVAWADARTTGSGPGIYTQRVTSVGALSGSAVAVASGAGNEYYAPKLAYAPTANGFLLVYDRRSAGGADVFGIRLTATGAANGAAFAITAAAGDQLLPAVCANTADGTYMVLWADGRDGGEDLDLYAKMYTSAGVVHMAEYLVSNQTSVQAIPAVTFDTTRKHFMITWQDGRNFAAQGYDVYAQRAVTQPMTAQEASDELLEEFVNAISTTSGGANGAKSQLENAIDKLADGKGNNAINHLQNFINALPGLQSNGVITAAERTQLEAMAQNVIAQIQAGNY